MSSGRLYNIGNILKLIYSCEMKANKQHEGTEHVVNIFHLNVWILGKRNSFISMKKGVTCSKGGLKRWQPVAANLPENRLLQRPLQLLEWTIVAFSLKHFANERNVMVSVYLSNICGLGVVHIDPITPSDKIVVNAFMQYVAQRQTNDQRKWN